MRAEQRWSKESMKVKNEEIRGKEGAKKRG